MKNAHLLDDYLLSDFLQSMQHLATNDKYKCIFICHIDSLQKITSYTLMNELDYTISIPLPLSAVKRILGKTEGYKMAAFASIIASFKD